MDQIEKTMKAKKEELLELYKTIKYRSYELCIALIFIVCLIVVGLILTAIFMSPLYFSFYKIVDEINSIPPYSPFKY